MNSDGDYVLCTFGAGHYDPDGRPRCEDGKPGWHRVDALIWNGSGAVCIPHAAI
ncbi:hypothetical protein ACTU45_08965 [Streptomyces sp. 24-1644]|uniref:hypothetical protein n=1 Tax=Streptomyces sp. 24-1644 TaxID=3457315 RepID=UPI003FA7EE1A